MIKFIVAFSLFFFSSIAWSADDIKVGMTTALTGPSAELGKDMRIGVNSYFELVNKQSGDDEKNLVLIVRDDGYEPERAAFNMRKLIEEDGVVAVIGNVGTPTAIVTVPIAEEKKTLLFGAFSGGDVLRTTPASRYVINYRASYSEEITEIINALLLSGIKAKEIAFFTQQDGYGDAAYNAAALALRQHGFDDINQLVHGRYTRNTLNVEDAVALVLDAEITPKAVIMASSYAPSAKFITLLQNEVADILFLNLSFVGSTALTNALGKNIKNVIVTQAVPSLDSKLSIIDDYVNALKQLDDMAIPNEVSFEGFIAAKIFHQGLLKVSGEINSESIIDGLESLRGIDIGLGLDIFYDQTEHQAMHYSWPIYLSGGDVHSLNWNMLSSMIGSH